MKPHTIPRNSGKWSINIYLGYSNTRQLSDWESFSVLMSSWCFCYDTSWDDLLYVKKKSQQPTLSEWHNSDDVSNMNPSFSDVDVLIIYIYINKELNLLLHKLRQKQIYKEYKHSVSCCNRRLTNDMIVWWCRVTGFTPKWIVFP